MNEEFSTLSPDSPSPVSHVSASVLGVAESGRVLTSDETFLFGRADRRPRRDTGLGESGDDGDRPALYSVIVDASFRSIIRSPF